MTVDELENYILDVIEEHYSFLVTELTISRAVYTCKVTFPYKNLIGEGNTKEEALRNLLLKINNLILDVA